MHAASLGEFFQFLQCQLRMEAREVLDKDVEFQDAGAQAMWEDYVKFVTPNLGRNERWVPYHTAFGVHEFFLIESVHHKVTRVWNEKRRFMAIFVFRAHCKRDFFTEAQLPHLLGESFWRDPVHAFRPHGPLERSMLQYRKNTGRPLLTLCFRMIPERILKDDDQNLVRSILVRTQRLLEVAEKAWPVIKDPKKGAAQKFQEISVMIQSANGLGDTWVKMLTVCLDLAYPKLGLLESQCEVGIGASAPLRCLLPGGGAESPKEALKELTRAVNRSAGPNSKHFWSYLPKVERLAQSKFQRLPLILQQVKTTVKKMSPVTLQVQLCEYRQFRNSLARTRYGMPCDESMKLPDKERRLRPEDHFEYDQKRKLITFQVPLEGDKKIPFEASVTSARNNRKLAERVAAMCFEKLRQGVPKKDVEAFRQEMYQQCKNLGSKDAPESSNAWQKCKATLNQKSPVVCFSFEYPNGKKDPFQTTVGAAGTVMEAERIARLCYAKFESGAKKDDVLAYRAKLYKEVPGASALPAPLAKRLRIS